jgi:hypothetical protein
MFLNPFDGPRAKIERSKEHFNQLIEAERVYREEQPVHIETRLADDGGTLVFAIADKLPGVREATIVADILGNFRSALDLAVCEASRIMGAANLAHTYFHFAGSEQEWDKSVKNRMKAAPATLRSVVRAMQPWSGGNRLLYAMSKLATLDKHRLLVPMAGQTQEMIIDNFKVEKGGGEGRVSVDAQVPKWERGQREAQVMHVGAKPSEVVIGGPVVLSLKFAFGDVDAVPYQPVIPLLNQMGRVCEDAIDLIERVTQ